MACHIAVRALVHGVSKYARAVVDVEDPLVAHGTETWLSPATHIVLLLWTCRAGLGEDVVVGDDPS